MPTITPATCPSVSPAPKDIAAAIVEVIGKNFFRPNKSGDGGIRDLRIKLASKLRALELLGRYLGMWDGEDKSKAEMTIVLDPRISPPDWTEEPEDLGTGSCADISQSSC